MKKRTKFMLSLGTLLVTMSMASSMVFADTSNASFAQKYQENQNIETQLLSQVNTENVPSGNAAQLLATIQDISAQISALYASEQNLVQQKGNLPKMTLSTTQKNAELKRLEKKRLNVLKLNEDAWKLVIEYEHHPHQKGLLAKAIRDHDKDQKRLTSIDAKIAKLNKNESLDNWSKHPYHNALPVLDESILRLQKSEIHYTKELIMEIHNSDGTTTATTYGSGSGN
ncbi:hypothetical protein ACOJUR_08935 [Alicyclobacillus tolerans]|uniref:hypothetical protein n=1 Tax=Alicyclobacillus tolerans TaxID=90970 RepID=UPI003B78832D